MRVGVRKCGQPEAREGGYEMSRGNYQIPFDKQGNQTDYSESRLFDKFVDNFEFEDELIVTGHGRGRSSAAFETTRKSNGKTASVFVEGLFALLSKMINGAICGRFTFSQKGCNYGCCLMKDSV